MIVKQVDADTDDIVAFVGATARFRARGSFDEIVTGETYCVELHRKPVNGSAFRFCRHEHRSIDAAVKCAKQLMRGERRKPEKE
jgi:hypothetical protein